MKLVSLLLCLSVPLIGQAGTLIYPEHSTKVLTGSSLRSISDNLGLGLNPNEFVLVEKKTSLLGSHLYYQQMINGHKVEGSQVVVSVSKDGSVSKVYDSSLRVSQKSLDSSMPLVSESMAMELAWKHLNVNGKLLSRPEVALIYQSDMNLVYKVSLSTSSPHGHWEVIVDAHSGKVLNLDDASLPRMKRELTLSKTMGAPKFSSLSEALNSFELTEGVSFLNGLTAASGTAQVFDPNPTVTLGRTDLQDDTEASVFAPAYRNQDLKEISFSGGVYQLIGSKVTIKDFEGPTVAPVTTTDGHWVFERGQDGFTDAMTYLHIDRSIRYLESLGFKGGHAIFPNSLEVDSNGVNGADNSYYIPYARRLAFGHGCVDDNEDADVILHELGHAIQHHINSSWSGGDTGAMGEGFGDYWAASYSVTTEHGMEGNINWVFKFDGHNDCWPGRQLDSFSPTYDSTKTYRAHSQVNGGVSDELWSTPVFQAFLEMYKNGVSKSDIDKVILEAHFGLGSGIKMPQMATSIVKTAKALFPNKNYDQVFLKHFRKQKILE